ncbi:MAG: hypothetical protein IKT32_06610, partial [Clostridia bacterium]|nr:hypothetical protein [Clostridia bacterium]
LAPSLAEMLYYHEGKIYYNMKSWYKVNSVFSFKKSSSYMENMMGVKSKVNQIKRVKMNVFDMAKLGVLFCSKLLQLDGLSKRFVENFNRIVLPYYGRDISGSNAELFDLYKSIEKDIVKEFAIPVINDCAVMIYFGSLKEKAKKLGVLEEEINLYINNNGQVDSAGSATMLIKIVSLINEDERIKEDFINLSPAKLYEKYHANSSISPLLNEYLLKYGPRVRDELKLETVTMIEDKTLLYKLIKDNLLSEINSFANDSKCVQIPKKLQKSAEKAKKYIRNRENLRLYRTYVYSVVRNIFLAYAKNYLNEGRINEINDIFYLSKDEVLTGVGDFKAIIEKRKAKKDLFINAPTYKRVVFFNGVPLPVKYSEESSGLKGIPSGCGCVKARVSLMNEVSDQLKPGNIILTKRTDPGWISLFPKASGLVVEHGSMLSHSFVVARELNLPAVVGVENATEIIKDNDLIVLDGNKGEITIENN